QVLFARSWQLRLYAIPVVLALILPLHYSMPLPITVYLAWMTVSVFWQDYLTFGLLQNYIGAHLPTWATVAVVAGIFLLGHALLIPARFAPPHVLPALGILAMGVVFALLRTRLGSLHLLLALHLGWYVAFA